MRTNPETRGSRTHRELIARSPGVGGFTMVEIALCLGIVAIALVAIIGVMPTGLRVQKDNREDTIINQDGTLWLEAIRGGSRGLDYLTNYVDSITITNVTKNGATVTTFINSPGTSSGSNPKTDGSMTNGYRIVYLLSTPKYLPWDAPVETNFITANVRAISGSAVDKDKAAREMALNYLMTSEVVPFGYSNVPRESTNFTASGLPAAEVLTRSNLWLIARNQAPNFYELSLTLQGPVISKAGRLEALGSPKVFRTLVGGFTVSSNSLPVFLPHTYSQVQTWP